MDSSGHPERGRSHKRNGYNDPHSTVWGRRHISWLVPLFIVVSVVVFVVAMGVNDCPKHESRCVLKSLGRFSFQPLRENPLFGPSSRTLEKFGGLEWYNVVHRNQGWRLVSCIWLHAGVIHLLVCMLCLALVGIRLEQQFGYSRIGIIYLLSGFGGSILSAIFIRNRLPNVLYGASVSVGASSALFGLFGAMLSELLTNWTIYCNKVAAFITLITVVLVNLVVGILPWVDNFGHIGGFFTGLFLGFVLLMRPQFSWMERDIIPAHRGASKYNLCQLIAFIISLGLLISGFAVGLVMLFRGVNGNDHCSWCHYLSCVPTGSWKCNT